MLLHVLVCFSSHVIHATCTNYPFICELACQKQETTFLSRTLNRYINVAMFGVWMCF